MVDENSATIPDDEVRFAGPEDDAGHGFQLDVDEVAAPDPNKEGAVEGAEGKAEAAAAAEGTPAEAVALEGDAKVKIGDQEYTGTEIQELITAAGDRAELAAWRDQQQAAVAMTDFVAGMSPEYQERLFKFAGELDAEMRGQAPATSSAAPAGFKVPDGANVDMPKWDDMSEEMRAVVAYFSPYVNELTSLKSQLAAQGVKLDAFGKVIPDVESYVRGSREERAQTSAIAKLQADLGIAVTPPELQAAVKATGVSDPEAAWLKANAKRVAEAGAQAVAARAGKKPVDSPNASGRTFDPKNMTADQIARNLGAGMTMLDS